MNTPPQLPGISGLQEIGRNSLVVGYRGRNSDGTSVVVEVFVGVEEEARRDFFRGSALQRRMAHPGMPPVMMVGESQDYLYRVREFVEGRPGTLLFTEGPLGEERLLASARALVSTLAALHDRGYVHTEVQPHGLRVDSSGLIRFLDTGRSWAVRRPLPETMIQKMASFLAPEYLAGRPARCESDVYSLGLLLLALALGRPSPEVSEGLREMKTTSLSPGLKTILKSMLAAEPGIRPEAHTVYESLVAIQDINALMGLHSWRPLSKAETFMGAHPYPLVGREQEMARLLSLWRRCEGGPSVSLTVVGERGSGKRRLVEELRRVVKRAGGHVCRHEQDAVSGQPTLILCRSYQGRLPFPSHEPWLRISFAETEPVPDQEVIHLQPLPVGSCLHLTRSFLAEPVPEELQEEVSGRGHQLPGTLLSFLDTACEDGRLRPHFQGWTYRRIGEPKRVSRSGRERRARAEGSLFQAEEARQAFLELWPAIVDEDYPVASGLRALSTVLQCERVDLYSVGEGALAHLGASSSGPRRMDEALLERLTRIFEPVAGEGLLLYPLRFGSRLVGLLSIEWWDSGPRNQPDLHRFLQIAGTPFAFLLSARSGPSKRLSELAEGLSSLSQAVAEPGDIFTRLGSCLRACLDFECLVGWAASDEGYQRVLSDPPGRFAFEVDALQILGSMSEEFQVREVDGKSLLCLALRTEKERLGAVVLSRESGHKFSRGERELASSVARLAQGLLLNARVFGVQSRLLEKTRYRYLAAQIRPHFLFNSLNTLASLVAVDPEQAEDLILDTAEFLRTTFADRPEMVPVSEELRFLEIYLKLEKARFGERLSFRQEVEEAALVVLIPALTLQPLVENAVRHGVTPKAEGGEIRLRIVSESGGFRVSIDDDGLGFEPDRVQPTGTGVGLDNVKERLHRQFGEGCRWELCSQPGEGTRISFSVPR